MNVTTSFLILSGFVGLFGLVVAVMSGNIDDSNIRIWYRALKYVVPILTTLAAGLIWLRFRLLRFGQLPNHGQWQRHPWTNFAVSGLVLLGLVVFIARVTGLVYVLLQEDLQEASGFLGLGDDPSIWYVILWYVVGALAALSASLACLRLRLFLTLAWVVATSFSLLVYLVLARLDTQSASGAISHNDLSVDMIVGGLAVVGCLTWCLWNGFQNWRGNGLRAAVLGASAAGTLALTIFGAWISGMATVVPSEGTATQNSVPTTLPVTWEEVRRIIAKELNVPEQRVTPSTRLREDLKAQPNDITQIISVFEQEFGIQIEPPDDEIITTAQDALEFAQSPDTFRDQAWNSR
jgi:acyl carrier protein